MTLRLMLCAFVLLALGGCHIPRRWNDGSDLAPHRPRHRDRQGPPGLHRVQRRVGYRPHLRTRGGPDSLRWFWSLTVTDPMTTRSRTHVRTTVHMVQSCRGGLCDPPAWRGPRLALRRRSELFSLRSCRVGWLIFSPICSKAANRLKRTSLGINSSQISVRLGGA
jgi:hypothetical protein